jgi:acyl-CoA synthetase (AMP-forming)/AMP-acid ligase II
MLLEELREIHRAGKAPMIIRGEARMSFEDVFEARDIDVSMVKPGEVAALVGDFDAATINAFLTLVDRGAIVAPLSPELAASFPYFFETAGVDWAIQHGGAQRIRRSPLAHPILDELRARGHAGLILFSSGTTGRPKAILHDFAQFLARFRTPRPALKTLNFLLFDHIGGINTLFHTMFNRGQVVIPSGRAPEQVVADIGAHRVELLPTTPTFLRMLLLSGLIEAHPEALSSLKVVTYGTEPMDEATLKALAAMLPAADPRQTYGMSELGILRVKSKARDSLWMSVGGEGAETRIGAGNVLEIRSASRMLGYLNAPDPFRDGWYDTGDVVETDGTWIKIIGRSKQIINVGGIKILPTEVERIALLHPAVIRAKATGAQNPITGQHVEVTCEMAAGASTGPADLRTHFAAHMPEAVRPHRIRLGEVPFNHRFKKE